MINVMPEIFLYIKKITGQILKNIFVHFMAAYLSSHELKLYVVEGYYHNLTAYKKLAGRTGLGLCAFHSSEGKHETSMGREKRCEGTQREKK